MRKIFLLMFFIAGLFSTGMAANLQPDKTFIDFGNIRPDMEKYESVKITNHGPDNVTIIRTEVENYSESVFYKESTTCNASLSNNTSCVVIVKFSADSSVDLGSYNGALKVFTSNGTVTVPLTGNVVGSKSILVSSVLDFGYVHLGTSSNKTENKTLEIINDGDVDVTITGIEGIEPPFRIEADDLPKEVKAGSNTTLSIFFEPLDVGNYSQSITILTDEPSLKRIVLLKGSAILEAKAENIYFTVDNQRTKFLSFPDVFPFERVSKLITVHNPTDEMAFVSLKNIQDFEKNCFTISEDTFSISPFSNETFIVTFTPERRRFYSVNATFKISFVGGGSGNSTLRITGRGVDFKVDSSSGVVGYTEKLSSIPSPYAKPDGITPLEAVRFSVFNFYPLNSVGVDLSLYAPEDDVIFYKIASNGEWIRLPDDWYDSVTKTLHLNLTDNGIYDLNPDTNIIEDPIVIAVPDTDVPPAESGNAGGGGGGGCSISNVTPINGAFTLLLLLLALAAGTFIFKRVGGTGEF